MDKGGIVHEWDLESDSPFGIVEHSALIPSEEWRDEINKRKERFMSLPPFVFEISNSIKKKIRHGIPPTHRRRIWLVASGGFQLLQETGNNWNQILKMSARIPENRDGYFGSTIDIMNFLPPDAVGTLRLFLHVLWAQNRSVEFAPLIPSVASIILMFMEPPLAYYTMQAMINRSSMDSWYFTHDRNAFLASTQAIERLANIHCPSVTKHAQTIGISIAEMCLTIFPTFFLPFSTLPVALTIFDSFVFEGRKILLRLCLAVLIQEKENLLRTKDGKEFFMVLLQGIEGVSTVPTLKNLLKNSFKISLSRERHIDPAEQNAMKSKEGLLGNQQFVNANQLEVMIKLNNKTRRLSNDVTAVYTKEQQSRSTQLNNTISHSLKSSDFRSKLIHSLKVDLGIDPTILAERSLSSPKPNVSINDSLLIKALPTVIGGSLLSNSFFYMLRAYLPGSIQTYSPVMVFSMSTHGTCMSTLLSMSSEDTHYILVIKTDHIVFGAIIHVMPIFNQVLRRLKGDCSIIFNLTDVKFFKAMTHENTLLSPQCDSLSIGRPEPAIYIADGFEFVLSRKSESFESPSLTFSRNGDKILDIEMFRLIYRPI